MAACPGVLHITRTAGYSARLATHVQQQRAEEEFTDWKILCEDRVFECHRTIITASSPVLKAMVRTKMDESASGEVRLDNIPADIMQLLLDYMYTGESSIPDDQVLSAAEACDYLELSELKQLCAVHAVTICHPHNVISCFKVAESVGLDELKARCSDILASSFDEVAKGMEFLELNFAEVSSYIEDAQETDVDPDDLLDASMKWTNFQASERLSSMESLIQSLPLHGCSAECLDEDIEQYDALLDSCLPVFKLLNKSLGSIAKEECRRRKRKQKGTINMRLLVLGGQGNNVCWELDSSRQFVELCKIPVADIWNSVCQTAGGFIVSGGCSNRRACNMFILSTNSWKSLENLTKPISEHGSLCLQGKMFIFGGVVGNSDQTVCSVQSLKLAGGKWIDEASLPHNLGSPAVASIDSSIFLLDVYRNELLCLDKERKAWLSRQKMPGQLCTNARMVAVQGELLVAGGVSKTFARYTPATNTWWCASNVPTVLHDNGAVIYHQQKLYVMGGYHEDKVEEYNEDTNTWSLCDFRVPEKLGNLHAFSVPMV